MTGVQILTKSTAEGVLRGARPTRFSAEYLSAFHDYARSGKVSAVMTETAGAPGDFPIPTLADGHIVPLEQDAGAIRRLASVIPTTADIRFNAIASSGAAALKPEATPFAASSPTFRTITLSAFLVGATNPASWELVADFPAFANALSVEYVPEQNAAEENLFINGTGIEEPQGLIGNVGAGIVASPDAAGNLVTIEGTESLIETVPAKYLANAAWLMTRATGLIIRRAQRQAGLVDRVWTRENGRDYLLGYPVEFSEAMPAAASGSVPILFGSFSAAYLIGDRGGSAVCLKVLDQINAVNAQSLIMAYRRTDGRVLRPQAVQPYRCA